MTLPYDRFSDGFVFDSQFLISAIHAGFKIGEIPVPVRYMPEASSIGFTRSVRYGIGTLWTLAQYLLSKSGLARHPIFSGGAGRGHAHGSDRA
jgi:hypothetical protein